MASIIYIVISILFLVLIGWTWSNLTRIKRNKKIMYIIISLIIIGIITFLICMISQIGVEYENDKMIAPVRNILVAVFTPINGFVIVQYIARILGRINVGTISQEEAKKKFIIIFVIFIIFAIIECLYMRSIQGGIIDMYNSLNK